MLKSLVELHRYRDLVRHMVTSDLKLRYRKSVLGILWTVLNPILLMVVLWAVFSRVMPNKEDNYALFLLAGLMIWLFFQQALEHGQNSIVKNKSLIQKIYIPKLVFPVTAALSNVVNLGFFLVAYVLMALVTGFKVPVTMPLILPVVVMLLLLGTGFSLVLASLNVFFRDFTHLTGVVLRAMFYVTPVIYRPGSLGADVEALLRLNPVYYPVIAARDVLYFGVVPPANLWLTGFAVAIVAFVVGLFVFTRVQDKFVYYA